MEWCEIKLDGSRTTQFPKRALHFFTNSQAADNTYSQSAGRSEKDYIGGIINAGQWGWLASNRDSDEAALLIFWLDTGDFISRFSFNRNIAYEERWSVQLVEELFCGHEKMLAVCLKVTGGTEQPELPGSSMESSRIAICSVNHQEVLNYIMLDDILVNSLMFINCIPVNSFIEHFDGCLALGTQDGDVLLIDIGLQCLMRTRKSKSDISTRNVNIFSCTDSLLSLKSSLNYCRKNDIYFALELSEMKPFSAVICLLAVDTMESFACGRQDGSIFLYSLKSLQLICTVCAPVAAAVQRMCCLVPSDDPCPCLHICAMHNSGAGLSTALHTIYYNIKYNSELVILSCSLRFFMELEANNCSTLSCSGVDTFSLAGDKGTNLAVISWYSHADNHNKLILFDLNQWYKDEMPTTLSARKQINYMAGYVLSGLPKGLQLFMKPASIMHFDTLQRFDEHFYPNSLSFECLMLTSAGCRYYSHQGVQHLFLNKLGSEKATIFLQPQLCFKDILRYRLIPQFCELDVKATFSKSAMYELILSVALEHDCMGLLNDCVESWVDGSYLRNMLDTTELSLSTLTNWIIKRAGQIKNRCVEICQGLFDYGGYPLDDREKKEYKLLCTQLEHLLKLQAKLIQKGQYFLTQQVLDNLTLTENALCMTHEYQRMLYWLIDQNLLPEGHESEAAAVRQPFHEIKSVYQKRRSKFGQLSNQYICPKTGTCKLLYIDALLQRSCYGKAMRECWLENGGNGLYPPKSLEFVLPVLLTSRDQQLQKQEFILYFLLDLDVSIDLIRNFAMTFNLSESLCKSVKSFWHLDHGNFTQSVNELLNAPIVNHYQEWQVELLIDVLLTHDDIENAMRVIVRPPGKVSPLLHLKTLLINDNIPAAFHHARLYNNENGEPLLEYFFQHCVRNSKFKVLGELGLRESEGALVFRLLHESKSKNTECVRLIMLLQKCKYIEAVNLMDDAAEVHGLTVNAAIGDSFNEASNMMLTAYRSTMAPFTQSIAGTYFRIKDNLVCKENNKKVTPGPFSSQLVKHNANNMLGGMFESSALSVGNANSTRVGQLNSAHNMPFLRNPQENVLSNQLSPHQRRNARPTPYVPTIKRKIDSGPGADSQNNMQLRKRRRLLGEEIVEDVYNSIKNKFGKSGNKEMESDRVNIETLLQQPVYRRHKAIKLETRPMLRTILKNKEEEVQQPPLHTMLKEKVVEEQQPERKQEKRSCIVPSIPLHINELEEDNGEEEHEHMECDETDEIIVELQPPTTLEEDKQHEDNDSDSDNSDAEYYSPLNSLIVVEKSEGTNQSSTYYTGPQPRSSLLSEFAKPAQQETQKSEQVQETSSGFVSFEQPIGAVGPLSNTNEFIPTVCSSKVCDTQSVFSAPTVSTQVKVMSERTTICVHTLGSQLSEQPCMEPSSEYHLLSGTASGSAWPVPLVPQSLKMLNTTLGMSSYELTSLEPPQAQPVTDSNVNVELEQSPNKSIAPMEQTVQSPENEMRENTTSPMSQEDAEQEQHSSSSSNEEDEEEISYNIPYSNHQAAPSSPSFSLSSELTDMSSETDNQRALPTLQEHPLYSIAVESTGSITTSRSITRTPNSFLPSDTNVSQNSSPRGERAADDGSPRSLYRANSLETVDDLDTTKGSMEDEEEEDEDDCVIALDGTEVRGYVPRPAQADACSSAELFAFKNDCKEEGPEKSANATANSDSVVAISDSMSEVETFSVARRKSTSGLLDELCYSQDSVSTVAFGDNEKQLKNENELDAVNRDNQMLPSIESHDELETQALLVSNNESNTMQACESTVNTCAAISVEKTGTEMESTVDQSVEEQTVADLSAKESLYKTEDPKANSSALIESQANEGAQDLINTNTSTKKNISESTNEAQPQERSSDMASTKLTDDDSRSLAPKKNKRFRSTSYEVLRPDSPAASTRNRRPSKETQPSDETSNSSGSTSRAHSLPPTSTLKKSKNLMRKHLLEVIEECDSSSETLNKPRRSSRTRLNSNADSDAELPIRASRPKGSRCKSEPPVTKSSKKTKSESSLKDTKSQTDEAPKTSSSTRFKMELRSRKAK